MQFTLYYRGPLKANGDRKHKHDIRRHFHPQLKKLWSLPPLDVFHKMLLPMGTDGRGSLSVRKLAGTFNCVSVVSDAIHTYAELDILLLRPEPPGRIVSGGGDLDNRLKTLFDALRVPGPINELPQGSAPTKDEDPFHCLSSDDRLFTRVNVDTAMLLERVTDDAEVVAIVRVTTKQTRTLIATFGFV